MRILRALLFAIPLIGLMASQSGCLLVAAAAGTGATVAYVTGDTEATLDADPRQVASATEQAMNDLDVAVLSNHASGLDAKVIGRTAQDTRMEVSVKSLTKKLSSVQIRAGIFGDEALQLRLLDKIKSNLDPGGTTAAPTRTAAAPATAPASPTAATTAPSAPTAALAE